MRIRMRSRVRHSSSETQQYEAQLVGAHVVDWGLQVIINGELWHTAPILLFDASEEMASTVRYLDLLICRN